MIRTQLVEINITNFIDITNFAPDLPACIFNFGTALRRYGIEKFGGDKSVRGRADGSERNRGAFGNVEQ